MDTSQPDYDVMAKQAGSIDTDPIPTPEMVSTRTVPTDQVQSTDDLNSMISQVASKHQLDPNLIHAVVKQESNYNPKVLSNKGAQGLMQLMPATAKMLGVNDPFDPQQNLEGGAQHLKSLLGKYNGDVNLALAAYNSGEGSVDHYNGIPPYSETQDYVKKIVGEYQSNKNPSAPHRNTPPVDYDAVARQAGATKTNVDYDALAKQSGAIAIDDHSLITPEQARTGPSSIESAQQFAQKPVFTYAAKALGLTPQTFSEMVDEWYPKTVYALTGKLVNKETGMVGEGPSSSPLSIAANAIPGAIHDAAKMVAGVADFTASPEGIANVVLPIVTGGASLPFQAAYYMGNMGTGLAYSLAEFHRNPNPDTLQEVLQTGGMMALIAHGGVSDTLKSLSKDSQEYLAATKAGAAIVKPVNAVREGVANVAGNVAGALENRALAKDLVSQAHDASRLSSLATLKKMQDAGIIDQADFDKVKGLDAGALGNFIRKTFTDDAFNEAIPERNITTTATRDGATLRKALAQASEEGKAAIAKEDVFKDAFEDQNNAKVGAKLLQDLSLTNLENLDNAGQTAFADQAMATVENHVFRKNALLQDPEAQIKGLLKDFGTMAENDLLDRSPRLKQEYEGLKALNDLNDAVKALKKKAPQGFNLTNEIIRRLGNGKLFSAGVLGVLLGHAELGALGVSLSVGRWMLDRPSVLTRTAQVCRSLEDLIRPEAKGAEAGPTPKPPEANAPTAVTVPPVTPTPTTPPTAMEPPKPTEPITTPVEEINKTSVQNPSVSDDIEKWKIKTQNRSANQPNYQKVGEFKDYDIENHPTGEETNTLSMVDKSGNIIADLFYGKARDGKNLEGAVEVHPNYRRQGIASNLYEKAEELSGQKFVPSYPHTEAAEALWKNPNRKFGINPVTETKTPIEPIPGKIEQHPDHAKVASDAGVKYEGTKDGHVWFADPRPGHQDEFLVLPEDRFTNPDEVKNYIKEVTETGEKGENNRAIQGVVGNIPEKAAGVGRQPKPSWMPQAEYDEVTHRYPGMNLEEAKQRNDDINELAKAQAKPETAPKELTKPQEKALDEAVKKAEPPKPKTKAPKPVPKEAKTPTTEKAKTTPEEAKAKADAEAAARRTALDDESKKQFGTTYWSLDEAQQRKVIDAVDKAEAAKPVVQEPAPKSGALYPATDELINKAKQFALMKWKERANELGKPEPKDLNDACKFCSVFAQKLFGGELRGNSDHQFLKLGDKTIDLAEGTETAKNYKHDPEFWMNPEHKASIDSVKPRIDKWVEEFRNQNPTEKVVPKQEVAGTREQLKQGTPEATAFVNRFREQHPDTKLTDDQIIKYNNDYGKLEFRSPKKGEDAKALADKLNATIKPDDPNQNHWEVFNTEGSNRTGLRRYKAGVPKNEMNYVPGEEMPNEELSTLSSKEVEAYKKHYAEVQFNKWREGGYDPQKIADLPTGWERKRLIVLAHEMLGHALSFFLEGIPTKEVSLRVDPDHPELSSGYMVPDYEKLGLEPGKQQAVDNAIKVINALGDSVDSRMVLAKALGGGVSVDKALDAVNPRNEHPGLLGSDRYNFDRLAKAMGMDQTRLDELWEANKKQHADRLQQYQGSFSKLFKALDSPENQNRIKFSGDEVHKILSDVTGVKNPFEETKPSKTKLAKNEINNVPENKINYTPQEDIPGKDHDSWFSGSHVRVRPTSSKEPNVEIPLTVHHGTKEDIKSFEVGRDTTNDWGFIGPITTKRYGIFFAENPKYAKTFATARGGDSVIQAHLAIKNPFYMDNQSLSDDYGKAAEDYDKARKGDDENEFQKAKDEFHRAKWLYNLREKWEVFDGQEGKEFVQDLKKRGFDGAYLEEEGHGLEPDAEPQKVWVAFDPSQIRRVSKTSPTIKNSKEMAKGLAGR